LGKCKKRLIARAKHEESQFQMTRGQALDFVQQTLKKNPSSIPARKIILLFGLSAEELSESGVNYEILRSLDSFL